MQSARGFTLLELIIVIAISVILMAIAVPGFQTLMENSRLTSVAAGIKNNLAFARSQSVSLGNFVTVCPLEGNNCTANWINGIDIFIDSDQDGTYDNGEVLLKSGENFNLNDQLVFPSNKVTYTPDGHITGSSAAFRYCTGGSRVGVSIALSGRAKIIDDSEFENCD